jgi:HK97 gp10 family phage protein
MSSSLKGGPELLAFLDQLPTKLVKKVMRGAMRAGARPIQKEARLRIPKKSGLSAKSIKIDTSIRDGVVKATVKMTGKHSYVGPLIEHGVAPHFISVDPGQTASAGSLPLIGRGTRKGKISVGGVNARVKRGSLVINGKFVGGTVHHPGVAAHPFMRPALDTKAEEAVNAIGQYVAYRLTIGSLNAPVLEVDDE